MDNYPPQTQNGNVLFLILIAVALFAALSYAVTQSNRGGTPEISNEKAALAVSQIFQYIGLVDTAIDRMMILYDCDESQISFGNPDYPYDTVNPRSPTNKECHLHEPEGGAMHYLTVQEDWLLNEADYSSNNFIDRHGYYGYFGTRNIEETPTIASELVFILPFLNQKICDLINEKESITVTTSYGYWLGEHLGPFDFRTNDTTNQKPFKISCSTVDVGDARPVNTLHYVLLER